MSTAHGKIEDENLQKLSKYLQNTWQIRAKTHSYPQLEILMKN
jgi:hypothetical protein